MAQQLDNNLEKLKRILAVMDADNTLTKEDFIKSFEQVLQLILKIEQRNSQAVSSLEQTYQVLLQKFQNDHASSLADLKGQVDQVFVGKTVDGMKQEHGQRMSAVDAKLASVKNGNDGYTPKKGVDYFDGRNGLPGTKGLLDEKALQALKDELNKNIKDATKPKTMGMKKFVYSKTMDLSSQVDGTKKTFILDERVLKVNYLQSSQFPFIYRKTIDWTATDLRVTLTDAVTAPQLTQTLFANVDLMFYSK